MRGFNTRITQYRYKQKIHYGIVHQQRLLSLPDLARRMGENLPPRFEDFIASDNHALDVAKNLQANAVGSRATDLSVPEGEVSFLAPVLLPPKIVCLGLNYLDHAAETGKPVPKEPIIFMKPRTAIIGPNEKIVKPDFVKELDYEGELAIIIGKKAKNVPASEAEKCVFGYTIFNDISAREIQFGDKQWTRGKSFDTFAPMGPWVVTKDSLPKTENLSIRTWVNGEVRQNSSTKYMAFKVDEIIFHLSRVMTLEPCDVIATGTPAGVGFAMTPPRFLEQGDVVRVEIEGIGVLENEVV